MSKLLLFSIFTLTSSIGNGQEVDANQDILLQDPNLSLKYQRGPYLVYDCFSKHWVCTAEPEWNQCKQSREYAIDERDRVMPCSTVKKFGDDQACIKYQRILVNESMQNRFCLHPEIREVEKIY